MQLTLMDGVYHNFYFDDGCKLTNTVTIEEVL